jgi:hypothetical protein
MPGFGRRFAADPRDRNYLMRRMLPDARTLTLPTRKTWGINKTALDQGNTGTCVGHAWRNFLRCAPIRTVRRDPSAFDIYRSAVLKDPWADNDDEANLPDGDSGLDVGTFSARRGRGRHRLWLAQILRMGVRAAASGRMGANRGAGRARHQLVFELSASRYGRHRPDLSGRLSRRRPCVPLARCRHAASACVVLQLVERRLGQIRRILPALPGSRTVDP